MPPNFSTFMVGRANLTLEWRRTLKIKKPRTGSKDINWQKERTPQNARASKGKEEKNKVKLDI